MDGFDYIKFIDSLNNLHKKIDYQFVYASLIRQALNVMVNDSVRAELIKDASGDTEKILFLNRIFEVADTEIQNNCQTMIEEGVVSMYSTMEASVSDIAKRVFPYVYELFDGEMAKKMTISFSEMKGLDTTGVYNHFYKTFEVLTTKGTMYGYDRFNAILSRLGINTGTLEKHHKDNLFELGQLRNILVHKNGIADEQFVSMCPNFGATLAEKVHITNDQYTSYVKACSEFIVKLIEGIRIKFVDPYIVN